MNPWLRARSLITAPGAAWDAIDAQEGSVQQIYTGYVAIMAAILPVAYLVGFSFVGTGLTGGGRRVPLAHGLAHSVAHYVLSLGLVYALAVAINALAPAFDGRRDSLRAFKVAAYAPTATWLAGVFYVVPTLSILALAGLYSLYLLYVGLPRLMKVPADRALPYTFVIVLFALVLGVGVDVLAALIIPANFRGF